MVVYTPMSKQPVPKLTVTMPAVMLESTGVLYHSQPYQYACATDAHVPLQLSCFDNTSVVSIELKRVGNRYKNPST